MLDFIHALVSIFMQNKPPLNSYFVCVCVCERDPVFVGLQLSIENIPFPFSFSTMTTSPRLDPNTYSRKKKNP